MALVNTSTETLFAPLQPPILGAAPGLNIIHGKKEEY
jgi:hypothetical protein